MKNVFLTGSTGFIGRNILPLLNKRYTISAPARLELDLCDVQAVRQYLQKGQFDTVIHLANPTWVAHELLQSSLVEHCLRVFTPFVNYAELYGKMIYLGSGAEYGKHRDISLIQEEFFGEEFPRDSYGFSRFLMSKLAEKHDNIVNLRLFACHGPGDPPHKLIPSVIKQAREGNIIMLHQDCWFDYLYVTDIVDVLIHFIENENNYPNYNLCSGERLRISSIAEEVCRQMGVSTEIIYKEDGFNFEYTGSNSRLLAEIPHWKPMKMKDSITTILCKEGII